MTITVSRRDRGQNSFGPGGGAFWYVAISDNPAVDDLAAARAAVNTTADASVDGVLLFGIQAKEVLRNANVAAWICEARYGAGGGFVTAPSPSRPSFVGSLASEKIIRSKSVVTSGISGGGTAPARDNLIAVNSEGKADGTEILRPVFTVVYSALLTDAQVNGTYAAAWLTAFGNVNLSTYKGYPPGSLLFQSMSCEPQQQGGYSVRLEFGYRPPETGLAIGDGMLLANLDGWDYLDIVAVSDFDSTIEAIISKADFYYVHRLYNRVAFGDLGV